MTSKNLKTSLLLVLALFSALAPRSTFAQSQTPAAPAAQRSILDGPDPKEIPLPEIATAAPALPGPAALPLRKGLPEVLLMNDGTKVTTPEQWKARREEMKSMLQYYVLGQMPPAPGNVKGRELLSETLAEGKVKYRLVHLSFGPDSKLGLDIGILTPTAGGPFPAIITPAGTPPGATPLPRLPNGPTQGKQQNVLLIVGSDPANPTPARERPPVKAEDAAKYYADQLNRGYAVVLFNNNDCAEDTTLRNSDGSWAFRSTRFFPAYPAYDWGVLAGWVWGASRIADYLEQDAAIDKTKLIITGVSRTGKSAMMAAAFDERFMAAPVVTGGGGIGAYRFSGITRGGKEGLGEMMNKYPNWFSPKLRQFWGHTDKLPFDNHWFIALCAPRPFISLEGDSDGVSLANAVKQSLLGALPAYELLGAKDKLGINYAKHGHALTPDDWTAMLDFADQHFFAKPAKRSFFEFLPEPVPAVLKSPFNVRDFGAVADGLSKDTRALQRALDTCAVSGGGEVIVPAGKYLIGSVQLGNRTVLRLEEGAVLIGSPDLEDYPMIDIRWEGRLQPGRRALIHAAFVDNIAIVGKGHIEGNPAVAAAQNPRGSVVIEHIACNKILWEGFSVTQGGNWATHPTFCDDIVIRNVTIRGKRDGIDIDSCRRVLIEGCDIDSGDDAISIKSGRGMDGARLGRPSEDILIRDSKLACRRFACIGIGSETSGGVKNVQVERCRFIYAHTHAVYIKTRIGRAGVIENISVNDCDMDEGNFLRVNLVVAGNKNTADDSVEGPLGVPTGRNFSFRNIRVKCKNLAEVVQISPDKPLEGFVFENITGTCESGISMQNVRGAQLSDLKVTGFSGPLLATHNVTGTGLEGAVEYTPPPAAADPAKAIPAKR